MSDLKELMKIWEEGWTELNTGKLLLIFADEFLYEDMAAGHQSRSFSEMEEQLYQTAIFSPRPNFKMEAFNGVSDGKIVAFEWIMSGVNRDQPLTEEELKHVRAELPCTGNPWSVKGVSVLELKDGKVTRCSDYWDRASMMATLNK